MRTFLKTDNGRDVYLTALVYQDGLNAEGEPDGTYRGVAQFSLESQEGVETITKSFEMPTTAVVSAAIVSYDTPEPVEEEVTPE